jgi:hypothetical protein
MEQHSQANRINNNNEYLVNQNNNNGKIRHMFADGFEERHDLEQYFWSEKTVDNLMEALRHICIGESCCLTTPSLAHAWHVKERRDEVFLDIDRRFEYLPKFHYFDLRAPHEYDMEDSTFRLIVFDPPFFYIPMTTMFEAVCKLANYDFDRTKLLIGFLKREECVLLKTFEPFYLKRTKFCLEYATVKPNKWQNYALYSNVDLPGIKRITK